MPSWELFELQDQSYKETVFPASLKKRLAVEAGSPIGWHKYVTDEGAIIGIERYGESAPGDEVMKEFGFTADHIVKKARELIR
jgi:transketolase